MPKLLQKLRICANLIGFCSSASLGAIAQLFRSAISRIRKLSQSSAFEKQTAWCDASMPADIPITIACGNYDRTRAIRDGRVNVEGCAVTYLPLYPEEIFYRLFHNHEFDVAEMSFSSYIRTVANGDSTYIGVPAFASRVFRHSGFYVRADSGIERPEDLRGRLVGLPEYQITAVVWMRGLLQHEYGVSPNEVKRRQDGQEQAGRKERTPLKPIPGVDLQAIPEDKNLVQMLEAGELDALFTAPSHQAFWRESLISSVCSRTCVPWSARTMRKPKCFPSCIWWESARRSWRSIPGCQRACSRPPAAASSRRACGPSFVFFANPRSRAASKSPRRGSGTDTISTSE